jgi:hypothetical protein
MVQLLCIGRMRHRDSQLTDEIYPDENLFGVERAIDVLPSYTASAFPIASSF